MWEIAETLERNAQEVRYGSVGVELRIHDGRVVKAIYKTAKTTIERPAQGKKALEPGLVRLQEQQITQPTTMDRINDFIKELYADGTVERWKQERTQETGQNLTGGNSSPA